MTYTWAPVEENSCIRVFKPPLHRGSEMCFSEYDKISNLLWKSSPTLEVCSREWSQWALKVVSCWRASTMEEGTDRRLNNPQLIYIKKKVKREREQVKRWDLGRAQLHRQLFLRHFRQSANSTSETPTKEDGDYVGTQTALSKPAHASPRGIDSSSVATPKSFHNI